MAYVLNAEGALGLGVGAQAEGARSAVIVSRGCGTQWLEMPLWTPVVYYRPDALMGGFTLTVGTGEGVPLKTLSVEMPPATPSVHTRPRAGGRTQKAEKLGSLTQTTAQFAARLEDFTGSELFSWIAGFTKGFLSLQTVAFDALDSSGATTARTEFRDTLIKSVSFTAFDATSKDKVEATVKVGGEARYLKGDSAAARKRAAKKGKGLQSSNFRLEIGDLPTENVTKVEPITVGSSGNTELVIHFPDTDVQPYTDWVEQQIRQGAGHPGNPKDAVLSLLTGSLTESGVSLEFRGLQIMSLKHGVLPSGESVPSFECRLSCAGVTLKGK